MNFEEVLKTRKSIRKYKKKAVSKATIGRLVNAARLAPSSHNVQPWHFIVVSGKSKEKVVKVLEKASLNKKEMLFIRMILKPAIEIIRKAPLVILIFSKDHLKEKLSKFTKYFGKNSGEWKKVVEDASDWTTQSTSCAIQNMLLEAHSMGLGGVWLGITLSQKATLQKIFKTKNNFQGIVTVGYPDERPKKTKRYSISEVLSYYD